MRFHQVRRREFLTVLFGIVAWPLPARAQEPEKVARIGFLGAISAGDLGKHLDALRQGLRDLGYAEGKDIVIEYRWAEGKYEHLPELAAELVRLDVRVIVTHGTPGSLAAKRATTTVPIVMAIGDAVATGLVQSIARPGANVTGSTFFFPELNAKRLELIKEAVPHIRRVGVLLNPDNLSHAPALKAMEEAAKSLRLEIHPFAVTDPGQFASAFSTMIEKQMEAVEVVDDRMLYANGKTIANLAISKRLPIIGGRDLMEGDGLMIAYGVDFIPMYRRAATFVDKILKGAKPADLPIEQATKFELVINLKAAKALGLIIPLTLLARADEVIE
jgi:putative ABC transport system substrate-binding protein